MTKRQTDGGENATYWFSINIYGGFPHPALPLVANVSFSFCFGLFSFCCCLLLLFFSCRTLYCSIFEYCLAFELLLLPLWLRRQRRCCRFVAASFCSILVSPLGDARLTHACIINNCIISVCVSVRLRCQLCCFCFCYCCCCHCNRGFLLSFDCAAFMVAVVFHFSCSFVAYLCVCFIFLSIPFLQRNRKTVFGFVFISISFCCCCCITLFIYFSFLPLYLFNLLRGHVWSYIFTWAVNAIGSNHLPYIFLICILFCLFVCLLLVLFVVVAPFACRLFVTLHHRTVRQRRLPLMGACTAFEPSHSVAHVAHKKPGHKLGYVCFLFYSYRGVK